MKANHDGGDAVKLGGSAENRNFFKKFFYEQEFNPMALYKIEPGIDERGAEAVRYLDVNGAYEKVHNVRRKDVVGKTFMEVWPNVEDCWSDIIVRCVRENRAIHCESESVYTDKYLEAIAFPISENRAVTIFLDRTELKKSEEELKQKQKMLLEYQAKLRALAIQLTISEETTRREIATDLHDSIGHSLLSLLLDLRKLKEIYTGNGEAGRIIDNSIKSTEEMITQSRALIFELSPPILLEVGITPALEALADKLLVPHGIKWYVTTRGSIKDYSADDAVCVILYRLSREVLMNVIKHAKATSVHISVNRGPNKIQVVIEDDGVGIRPSIAAKRGKKSGLGLFSIRERLLHIGGDLRIISNESGTTVSMLAPLKLESGAKEEERGE
ncbi:ATP-binding protein [Cloacibacillus sp. An23]|uniref:sensor histidine kinase n=1 Tax=Cloacibacillus sp. An23 TaxID=1965591 RepID=UPI000B36AFCE|nr:ATP-binding protein [Cloacibacillus sp. An23]OUO95069.1 histidine kinase [Cloacibacillus sp. An23]